jgi:hypothetical protein
MNDPIPNKTIDERGGWTSASSAQADSLCPGRHFAQRSIPVVQEQDTEDARSGRLVHAAIAAGTTEGLPAALADTADACLRIERNLVARWIGQNSPANLRVTREKRFWVNITSGDNGTVLRHSGKPDVVYRAGDKALILEYKALYGDVPVSPRNLQLRDQQVLVRGNLIIPGDITVAVIQPRLTHDPELCVYDRETSEVARLQLFERVKASNDSGSPRVAGQVQCQHCRARAFCQEYHQWAGGSVPQMLSLLDVPVQAWTPEQRLNYWTRRSMAYDWLELIDQAIRDGMEKDAAFLPGYEIAPGKVRQSINKPEEVFKRFVQSFGGTSEQFLTTVIVGKTKLKEILATITKVKGKALDTALKTLIEGCYIESTDKGSIRQVKELKQ